MAVEGRKFKSKSNYLIAFLVGTLIFLIGFGITYAVSFVEYQRMSEMQQSRAYSIFEDTLKYELFNETLCENSFSEVSNELAFQGRIIDDLEKKFGKDNQNVLFRKRFYTLTEIEHFEFLKTLRSRCNFTNINTILFFYSNAEDDLGASETTGRMLDALPEDNRSIIVYSFDINLDSPLISSLKKKYGIEKSPTVVINEESSVFMPANIDEIEQYLK